MAEFGLGRLPSVDPRDRPMRTLLPAATVEIPNSQAYAFPYEPLDQGRTSTCTAHALTHLIMCSPYRHKVSALGFTPMQLYREGIVQDPWPQNDAEAGGPDSGLQFGSDGRSMVKALQARGFVREYRWGQLMREVTEWLATFSPVAIGVNWYPSMFNPTREGFVRIGANERPEGGHEVALRRVNIRRGLVWGINSWGSRWNSAPEGYEGKLCKPGHFVMDFETLERLMHEDGDAVAVIEQKLAA